MSTFHTMDLDNVFADETAFIRYRVRFFEEAVRKIDFEKAEHTSTCQIHDYKDMSALPVGNMKKMVSAVTKVFGDNYPELKGTTIFVNLGAVYVAAWNVFSNLMPAKTRRKMLLLGQGFSLQLFEYIPPEICPQEYGGMLEEKSKFVGKDIEVCKATIPAWSVGTKNVCDVKAGKMVYYQFRVLTKDMYVTVRVVQKDENSRNGYPKKYDKDEGKHYSMRQCIKVDDGVINGSFKSSDSGVLQIVFDNYEAYINGKEVLYRGYCE